MNTLALVALAVAAADARSLTQNSPVQSTPGGLLPQPTSFCSNGIPRPFSECGYEAFDSYSSASLPNEDAWANAAISTYIKRKGWPSSTDFKVLSVPVVCQSEYEDRVWGMLIEAKIDGSTTYIQARPYGDASEKTPDFDCVDNICIRRDDVRECDRDDDDDDDDRRDDD